MTMLNHCMSSGKKGLRIEAPSDVISGGTFKVIVTYNEYPASKAQLTFEGAVIDPVKTDSNGVALVRAPTVTKPTKVMVHINYRSMLLLESYSSTSITILPKTETKERNMQNEHQILFKGRIRIASENYWASGYELESGSALLISIKTDGKTINEYVLDRKSYLEYTTNKTIRAEHYHYNVLEGEYTFNAPYGPTEEWHIVLENAHKEAVSVNISISKVYAT